MAYTRRWTTLPFVVQATLTSENTYIIFMPHYQPKMVIRGRQRRVLRSSTDIAQVYIGTE